MDHGLFQHRLGRMRRLIADIEVPPIVVRDECLLVLRAYFNQQLWPMLWWLVSWHLRLNVRWWRLGIGKLWCRMAYERGEAKVVGGQYHALKCPVFGVAHDRCLVRQMPRVVVWLSGLER